MNVKIIKICIYILYFIGWVKFFLMMYLARVELELNHSLLMAFSNRNPLQVVWTPLPQRKMGEMKRSTKKAKIDGEEETPQ